MLGNTRQNLPIGTRKKSTSTKYFLLEKKQTVKNYDQRKTGKKKAKNSNKRFKKGK